MLTAGSSSAAAAAAAAYILATTERGIGPAPHVTVTLFVVLGLCIVVLVIAALRGDRK